jgi:signal transduction histidine kinase
MISWRELWQISRFRLTLLYGALFAVGVIGLLGLVYWQTAGFMAAQVDQILEVEAREFVKGGPAVLPKWINQDIARDARRISYYGLFSADGTWITGNIDHIPRILETDAPPRELSARAGLGSDARAMAVRLPWGEILVVGRDVTQLAEIRLILLQALGWSGAAIVIVGLGLGGALSVRPLRRIAAIQEASQRIMEGDLAVRLPSLARGDELDVLAAIVNTMLDEVHRLVGEVKSASDSLAHDLRTPLTRLRALLYRLEQQPALAEAQRAMAQQALAETDALLARFQALLRISEIETKARREGFSTVDLAAVLEQIRDLYEPLAAERGLELAVETRAPAKVQADGELIFEAVNNLVDNAIKFTPCGGRVAARIIQTHKGPRLEIADTGPGVPALERAAVLQRFYRSARDRGAPGSGLGLSIVAAIARLHGFSLELEDARPGLRATLSCWPSWSRGAEG